MGTGGQGGGGRVCTAVQGEDVQLCQHPQPPQSSFLFPPWSIPQPWNIKSEHHKWVVSGIIHCYAQTTDCRPGSRHHASHCFLPQESMYMYTAPIIMSSISLWQWPSMASHSALWSPTNIDPSGIALWICGRMITRQALKRGLLQTPGGKARESARPQAQRGREGGVWLAW